MIKIDKSKIEIMGEREMILTEIAYIIHSIRERKLIPDEMLKYAIELAFEDDKKRHIEAQKIIKNMSKEQLEKVVKKYMEDVYDI